ncbi:MAG: hypothetical protein WC539_08715 [Nitrospirota bacterium]
MIMLFISGCYRTVYMNVQGDASPKKMTIEELEKIPDFDETHWQHFFIYGWVPSEKIINAADICGGAGNIASIKTRLTPLEGLVGAVAGYYINIYSPYDGNVVCYKNKASKN